MEVKGLERRLKTVSEGKVKVKCLVTDQNRSVGKYMRDNHKEIPHNFDIWYLVKQKFTGSSYFSFPMADTHYM